MRRGGGALLPAHDGEAEAGVWISEEYYWVADLAVTCAPPRNAEQVDDPSLVVEVLSKSTKNYDRGEKFEQYRKIESFVECLLIAQDRPHVEHNTKQADGTWVLSETKDAGAQALVAGLSAAAERDLRKDRRRRRLTWVGTAAELAVAAERAQSMSSGASEAAARAR